MSIYATNGNHQNQFASNVGWGDVSRWVAVNSAGGPMSELCQQGWYEPCRELLSEVESIKDKPQDETIRNTMNNLYAFLEEIADDDPVVISNGMELDDGTDDE